MQTPQGLVWLEAVVNFFEGLPAESELQMIVHAGPEDELALLDALQPGLRAVLPPAFRGLAVSLARTTGPQPLALRLHVVLPNLRTAPVYQTAFESGALPRLLHDVYLLVSTLQGLGRPLHLVAQAAPGPDPDAWFQDACIEGLVPHLEAFLGKALPPPRLLDEIWMEDFAEIIRTEIFP